MIIKKGHYIKVRKIIKDVEKYYKNCPEKLIQPYKDNLENAKKELKKSIYYRAKRNYQNERCKIDLKFNLNRKMSSTINYSLKGNKAGRHWETLVGYNLKDLIEHLKKTIPKNYVWEDLFNGKLHIDHKIPISAFNFTQPEHPDFKKCWALSNLQLLIAKENLIKHNKLEKPFQPALKIFLIS